MEKEVELDRMVRDAGDNSADENGERYGGDAAELRRCGEAIWERGGTQSADQVSGRPGSMVQTVYEPRIMLDYIRYKTPNTETAEPQLFF